MDRIIKQMEHVEGDVKRDIRPSVSEIVLLAEAYRRLGKDFTFDADAGLDAAVNQSLVRLSDRIISDIGNRLDIAIDEADADEFDLRCTENLRRGLVAEGAWDMVLRADAIIADGRKRIEQLKSRLAGQGTRGT